MDLIIAIKEIVFFLWWMFIGCLLLNFISHLLVATYKVFFCDRQIKLYKIWKKNIKEIDEISKISAE